MPCLYCGGEKTQHNDYGTFCKGCGAPSKKVMGTLFGKRFSEEDFVNDKYIQEMFVKYGGFMDCSTT